MLLKCCREKRDIIFRKSNDTHRDFPFNPVVSLVDFPYFLLFFVFIELLKYTIVMNLIFFIDGKAN